MLPRLPDHPRTLVIIPTYNECDNLARLVRIVLDGEHIRVLVVDDSSPDGTGEIADRLADEFPTRVEVLHRRSRRGLGRSYLEGFRHALGIDVDLIVQMDADFSHDPKYLDAMLAAAADHDLVLASRYLNGISVVNWPLRRLILSVTANQYIRAIAGLTATDCTGGFRCWRRDLLARIALDRIASDGYAFQVETLFEAVRAGARVGEVPIIFVERRQGASKLSSGVILESVFMPWRLRCRDLLRRGRPVARTGEQDQA